MQKQTSIYIPKPCHEDWNKMTSTQQGKFCSACNKQVVDFSLMSDNQVLNFLSSQPGRLCGRFDAEQLQRPLVETKIKKKKSWWMALTMPLLFLFDRSEAQENKIVDDTTYNFSYQKDTVVFMGAVSRIVPDKKTIIGKVVDETGKPIAYAIINEKGVERGINTDINGNFFIDVNPDVKSIALAVSAVGYESIEKKIKPHKIITDVTFQLKPTVSGQIVVVGYTIRHKPVTKIDTIKTTIKKICNLSSFSFYPNPVTKNSFIQIEIKTAGNYQMQLLDNQSRLVQAEEINVDTENTTTRIQLQSNITVGMYYLRLINEQKKKQYTEKLIIQ